MKEGTKELEPRIQAPWQWGNRTFILDMSIDEAEKLAHSLISSITKHRPLKNLCVADQEST